MLPFVRSQSRDPEALVAPYLALADRLVPGRVTAFYLVGSAALGSFRLGRSDIDFVAVIDGDLRKAEIVHLRALHAAAGAYSAWSALRRGHTPLSGTCNGVYIEKQDLRRPVSEIVPVVSHSARNFSVGHGSGVNPVEWKVLVDHGITIRGPAPDSLGLNPQTDLLRAWNLNNLDSYWRPWAEGALAGPRPGGQRVTPSPFFRPRRSTASAVLCAPRLHYTIATGEIASKEAAGEYALEVFDDRWHPIIREGLAYRRGRPALPGFRDWRTRRRITALFVLEVIRSAASL